MAEGALSLEQVRRIAIAAQGYAPGGRGTQADVEATIRRLSAVQLDSIATVDRSHRLALAARIGTHPADAVSKLLRAGRVVEYWAHEASLLPVEAWPLLRHRMRDRRVHHWWGDVLGREPALARSVLRAIEKNGPMSSREFEGKAPGKGMWVLKPEKRMLDALWTAGRLAVCGRESGFQRVYDLPERVIPAKRLAERVTRPQAIRALALQAIRARGALTEAGVAEHWRFAGRTATVRPALARLVREGEVARVPVAEGGPDVFVAAGTDLDPPAPRAAALLSPFDNLLWDRAFARRALGFDHLIEVYKKEHQRRFGYYVMPLVVGDRIVARADVKSDREAGALRIKAVHREPGVRWTSAQEDGLATAAARLAKALALREVAWPQ
ncbi:MAG: uncharacterized protein QOE90_1444 [Thermoplasmata archaeon]|nr:uncharacterized protein [Thermoplasmata archaeon]